MDSRLNRLEEGIHRIEYTAQTICNRLEGVKYQITHGQEVMEKMRGGMSKFTKTLAELLRPFFDWTHDEGETRGIELEEVVADEVSGEWRR